MTCGLAGPVNATTSLELFMPAMLMENVLGPAGKIGKERTFLSKR